MSNSANGNELWKFLKRFRTVAVDADKSTFFPAGVLNMSPNVNIVRGNICAVHWATAITSATLSCCVIANFFPLITFFGHPNSIDKYINYLILPRTWNGLANMFYDQSVCQVMS